MYAIRSYYEMLAETLQRSRNERSGSAFFSRKTRYTAGKSSGAHPENNRAFSAGIRVSGVITSYSIHYTKLYERKLLICSGPPYEEEKDRELAAKVTGYNGKVILCGGTTSDIVARELNRKIVDELIFEDPDLPPESFMEGIDLVTEGILTLQKVNELLKA